MNNSTCKIIIFVILLFSLNIKSFSQEKDSFYQAVDLLAKNNKSSKLNSRKYRKLSSQQIIEKAFLKSIDEYYNEKSIEKNFKKYTKPNRQSNDLFEIMNALILPIIENNISSDINHIFKQLSTHEVEKLKKLKINIVKEKFSSFDSNFSSRWDDNIPQINIQSTFFFSELMSSMMWADIILKDEDISIAFLTSLTKLTYRENYSYDGIILNYNVLLGEELSIETLMKNPKYLMVAMSRLQILTDFFYLHECYHLLYGNSKYTMKEESDADNFAYKALLKYYVDLNSDEQKNILPFVSTLMNETVKKDEFISKTKIGISRIILYGYYFQTALNSAINPSIYKNILLLNEKRYELFKDNIQKNSSIDSTNLEFDLMLVDEIYKLGASYIFDDKKIKENGVYFIINAIDNLRRDDYKKAQESLLQASTFKGINQFSYYLLAYNYYILFNDKEKSIYYFKKCKENSTLIPTKYLDNLIKFINK